MQTERRLIRLCEISEEEVSWLLPARIPYGALTLLEGDPGSFKSGVVSDLSAKVTPGPPCPAARTTSSRGASCWCRGKTASRSA